ncbi:MAG: non-canonical purine NTP pyrophosphatase [Chloroflexota bacterium]
MKPRGELLIATGSRHKFDELRDLLDLQKTDLLSLADVGLTDSADEDGASFDENAVAKALHYARLSGMPTLADDSGLEVDALHGRPGVRTRRYAGPTATDEDNNVLLLAELSEMGIPPADRTARYQCVLVLAEPTEDEEPVVAETARGTFEGRIATDSRGDGGFGYDPLFEPATEPVGGRTVGELTRPEKNEISHRAKAARAMRELLIARGY